MSTTAFARMESERLADEEYRDSVRIERLSRAGTLCAHCFATTIVRETNLGLACWRCTQCNDRWLAP